MIHSVYYAPDQPMQLDIPLTALPEVLQSGAGLLWVDFEGTPPEQDEPILTQTFSFHPLAVEDALQETHVPKIDDWGKYLYIVLQYVDYLPEDGGQLHSEELDVFLGKNYLITHHDHPLPAVDKAWSAIQRDERYLAQGSDYVLYRIVDEVVMSHMPVIEALDEAVDRLETAIFANPDPDTLMKLFDIKRSVLYFRRIIGPQREVLNKLARDDYAMIDTHTRVYFRDVYDHLVRLQDISESLRDLASGTLDTYLSVINNRTNDIMKILTGVTVIFMPLTFITGFFGMNFFAPETTSQWVSNVPFLFTMGILIATPLVMFTWMRRRGWMRL